MKNNLGKSILYFFNFCLLGLMLHAEDFSYTFHVDKTNPYVKEAVILTLDLNQTNPDIVLLFNFDLLKNDDYTFQRLDAQETDSYHQARVHYVYLVYPLKSGNIDISFKLLKKVTTDGSVAYSFSGDRDNVKGLVTVDTNVILPPLPLSVKPLPSGTLLVGDFSLTYSLPKHQAEPYEPLPFQVTLQGTGYPPLIDTLLPKEGNFTRFTEDPIVKSLASRQGTQNTVTYPMALSHSQSFTLLPVEIKVFDPQAQKSYTLTVPEQHFAIQKITTDSLVDKIDSPKPLKNDWSWLTTIFVTFLSYLVVFGAGLLTAITVKWRRKTTEQTSDPLKEKIASCKDEKALLQLLISAEDTRFSSTIESLEDFLYGEGKIHFKTLKQDLLEKIL